MRLAVTKLELNENRFIKIVWNIIASLSTLSPVCVCVCVVHSGQRNSAVIRFSYDWIASQLHPLSVRPFKHFCLFPFIPLCVCVLCANVSNHSNNLIDPIDHTHRLLPATMNRRCVWMSKNVGERASDAASAPLPNAYIINYPNFSINMI